MLIQTWTEVFTRALQDIGTEIISFTPKLFIALLIILSGWVVGIIMGRVVSQLLKTVKVDKSLREEGFEEVFNKAGFTLDSGKFLGGLVKWFIIIIFLVGALEVLELTQLNEFIQNNVLSYLPNVIAAVIILLIAAIVAELLQRAIIGSVKEADVSSVRFFGTVVRGSVWLVAALAALGQLGIAENFVEILFMGIVIALSLAVGLSFGLGGKEAAARYIEHLSKDLPKHKDKESKDDD